MERALAQVGQSIICNKRGKAKLTERADRAKRSAPNPSEGDLLRATADKIWLVSFLDFDLGYFDEAAARVEPGANPFASKVLTMSPV